MLRHHLWVLGSILSSIACGARSEPDVLNSAVGGGLPVGGAEATGGEWATGGIVSTRAPTTWEARLCEHGRAKRTRVASLQQVELVPRVARVSGNPLGLFETGSRNNSATPASNARQQMRKKLDEYVTVK